MQGNGSAAGTAPFLELQAIAPAIKIETGIPLPPVRNPGSSGRRSRHRKYPWRTMEIGDSFLFPLDGRDPQRAMSLAASNYNSAPIRETGRRFAARILVKRNGERVVRVWRVA